MIINSIGSSSSSDENGEYPLNKASNNFKLNQSIATDRTLEHLLPKATYS